MPESVECKVCYVGIWVIVKCNLYFQLVWLEQERVKFGRHSFELIKTRKRSHTFAI